MIHGITTSKTFHLYDKDTFPHPGFHLAKKLLHDGTSRNAITGYDFAVDVTDRKIHLFSKIKKDTFMSVQNLFGGHKRVFEILTTLT